MTKEEITKKNKQLFQKENYYSQFIDDICFFDVYLFDNLSIYENKLGCIRGNDIISCYVGYDDYCKQI